MIWSGLKPKKGLAGDGGCQTKLKCWTWPGMDLDLSLTTILYINSSTGDKNANERVNIRYLNTPPTPQYNLKF